MSASEFSPTVVLKTLPRALVSSSSASVIVADNGITKNDSKNKMTIKATKTSAAQADGIVRQVEKAKKSSVDEPQVIANCAATNEAGQSPKGSSQMAEKSCGEMRNAVVGRKIDKGKDKPNPANVNGLAGSEDKAKLKIPKSVMRNRKSENVAKSDEIESLDMVQGAAGTVSAFRAKSQKMQQSKSGELQAVVDEAHMNVGSNNNASVASQQMTSMLMVNGAVRHRGCAAIGRQYANVGNRAIQRLVLEGGVVTGHERGRPSGSGRGSVGVDQDIRVPAGARGATLARRVRRRGMSVGGRGRMPHCPTDMMLERDGISGSGGSQVYTTSYGHTSVRNVVNLSDGTQVSGFGQLMRSLDDELHRHYVKVKNLFNALSLASASVDGQVVSGMGQSADPEGKAGIVDY